MATYTTYLNLEKPTTSETFNLLKMNQNWDKIDAGVSALNSNVGKIVENGSITLGHIYCIHFIETTIANASFELLYNPNENQGIQTFSICLTNGTNIYCCTAKISLSNGQISVSEAYRRETGASGADAWDASIRIIRMIA